jgi:hypothetical protein
MSPTALLVGRFPVCDELVFKKNALLGGKTELISASLAERVEKTAALTL